MTHLIISISLILILVGIIILTLKISRRLGYKNIGIGIVGLIILIFLSIPVSILFKDFFFFKSNAKEILTEHGINLTDEFEFESKSISGIMDYTLQFDIQISKSDKEKIIKYFTDSPNKINVNSYEIHDIRSKVPEVLIKDTILYATYEDEKFWNFEYCKVLSNGYIQTWDIIQIPKNKNSLHFIRNE